MTLDIVDTKENEDGSLDITFNVDMETLKHFAAIGIIKILKDAIREEIEYSKIK